MVTISAIIGPKVHVFVNAHLWLHAPRVGAILQ